MAIKSSALRKLSGDNMQALYAGYSMVEMLITLVIVAFVLAFVGVLLTTMIKTTMMADARTVARSEANFMITSLRLNINNSVPENVLLFNNSKYSLDSSDQIVTSVAQPYASVGRGGSQGNAIHVLPIAGDRWICIAFMTKVVDSETRGYVIRTSAPITLIPATSIDPADHAKCFDPASNIQIYEYLTFLNSDLVSLNVPDVNNAFKLSTYDSPSGNVYLNMSVGISPVNWTGGNSNPLQPEYIRNVTFKTNKIVPR